MIKVIKAIKSKNSIKEKKISLAPHEIFFIIKREPLMKELYLLSFIIQSPIKAMNNTEIANIPNRNVAIKPKKNLILPSITNKLKLSFFIRFLF